MRAQLRIPFISKIISVLCLCFVTQAFSQDFQSIKDLAARRFPWLKGRVEISSIPTENGQDIFTLKTQNNRLMISASSLSAASKGLGWYVKHYAHQSISHLGDHVVPLSRLPIISQPVKKTSFAQYRYALNYVTINYSFSFYTWKDWERELDWMALNGVNLMLTPVGTELVWYNTLRKLGYTDSEARKFIPGVAYTAWWLMGNLEGWGGPMSLKSIKMQAALERKIMKRMKQLGIRPILQGFYGMVPHDISKVLSDFKNAPLADQGTWPGNEFRRPAILIPGNGRFEEVADLYYSELKKLYGSDIHFFGGDPFHEGGKVAGVDVSKVANEIQNVMQRNFPKSTWVLQGWQNNPSDQLLKGIDKNDALVIELFGENTDNWDRRKGYDGTPFIWANVSNFGGKTGLYGKLQRFLDEVWRAKASPYRFKGLGIIPEGIDNNPVAYDLTLDMAWYDQKPNLDDWVAEYTKYRYGKGNADIINAWKGFVQTVYSSPKVYQEGPSESIFCARPGLNVHSVSTWGTLKKNYDTARFHQAVKTFVRAENEFKNSETYRADEVDFLRQVLSNSGDQAYADLVAAIQSKDKTAIQKYGTRFLSMIRLQDQLLSYSRYFSVNHWLEQAKTFASGLPEAKQVLYEAKAQISFWGPDDDPQTSLRDYAYKEWNGLLGSLYYHRWKRFIDDALQGQTTSQETFYNMEVHWAKQADLYIPSPLSHEKFDEIKKVILK